MKAFRLLATFLCLQYANASLFHHKLNQHKTAHDREFHKALLKQLKESRLHFSNSNSIDTSIAPVHGLGALLEQLDSTSSNVTFATNSTATFQIYTTAMLPTSPPPPAACASALTAVLNCNSTVPLMSTYPYLLAGDLATVCTTACASSFASYRAKVVSACGTYSLPSTGNSTYRPTLAVDTLSGPYTAQCLQDPSSKAFCERLLASFNTTGGLLSLPNSQLCTYCTLETLNVTLSNPVSYSEPVAELLAAAVKQCGTTFTSYNVSTPPSTATPPIASSPVFGLNGTSTGAAADCNLLGRNITTTSNVTCSAISIQYSVSTYSIYDANPSLVGGSNDCSIASGTTLCLYQPCKLYTIKTNDTCESVAEGAGAITGTNITSVQLQSFNPDLGTLCQLMALKVNQTICLTPNGGFPSVGATSNANPSATPTAVAPVPAPTVAGTTTACGRWYLVQQGDFCNTVALNNTISLPDFLTLNPEVNTNCTNLWLGYYYCVAPFPPLSSSPAAPIVTANVTVGRLSYIAPNV